MRACREVERLVTDPLTPRDDAIRDALAYTRCTLRRDWEGRNAVARACEPTEMVDALTMLYLGLVLHHTRRSPIAADVFLDEMRVMVPARLTENQ